LTGANWSPDDTKIMIGMTSGEIYIYDAINGAKIYDL
jgi:hypothetical protein